MKKSRSESMKKIGRMVKESGHAYEVVFNSIFHKRQNSLNLSGATSDCIVNEPDTIYKLKTLDVTGNRVSLKSADTWQFHLGKIPELSDINFYINSIEKKTNKTGTKEITCGKHNITFEEQLKTLRSKAFWKKYLGKGDYLCYTDRAGLWRFFSMDAVIDYIIDNTKWRLLDTGRIKGDFLTKKKDRNDNTKLVLRKGIITFEFRNENHKQCFVLGAHGANNGRNLMDILSENIPFVDIKKGKTL